MSSSHPVSGAGGRTISGGLQWIPSSLSVIATLCLGRHETHILYLPASVNTQMSKHVPYCPPSTGFPAYFTQPLSPWRPKRREAREKGIAAPVTVNVFNSLLLVINLLSLIMSTWMLLELCLSAHSSEGRQALSALLAPLC